MRPTVPRFVRWTVALAVIAALVVAVFQYWGSAQYGAGAQQSGYRAILNRGLSLAVPPGPNESVNPSRKETSNPAPNPLAQQPPEDPTRDSGQAPGEIPAQAAAPAASGIPQAPAASGKPQAPAASGKPKLPGGQPPGRAPNQAPALASGGDWTPTPWGPLGPADRDLLAKLRQAGLTEILTGQQAQQQAASSQVRATAKRLWVENAELDSSLRAVAGTLGLALPNQPSIQQQGWMQRLAGLSGPAYDRMFAQQLRLTHGELLPLITSVRAGTRNELVRSLAANAATLVSRHMEYLERTGLVDFSRLPPPLPAAAPSTAAQPPATAPRPPTAAPRPPATAARPPAAAQPPATAAGPPATAAGPPTAAPSPGAPAAPVTGSPQQIDQVVNTTQVPPAGSDVKAMLAALVSVAALLIALGLLGTGRRVRRAEAAAQHRSGAHRHRHAAQRW